MPEIEIQSLIKEIRGEQQISPFIQDEIIIQLINEAAYSIDDFCETKINYQKDLKARALLKNYVLYARYKRLAEFQELYYKEYEELKRDYFIKSSNKESVVDNENSL